MRQRIPISAGCSSPSPHQRSASVSAVARTHTDCQRRFRRSWRCPAMQAWTRSDALSSPIAALLTSSVDSPAHDSPAASLAARILQHLSARGGDPRPSTPLLTVPNGRKPASGPVGGVRHCRWNLYVDDTPVSMHCLRYSAARAAQHKDRVDGIYRRYPSINALPLLFHGPTTAQHSTAQHSDGTAQRRHGTATARHGDGTAQHSAAQRRRSDGAAQHSDGAATAQRSTRTVAVLWPHVIEPVNASDHHIYKYMYM
eukprot:COSAG02_NODE_360_length_23829_cov_107.112769_7_plen_256_part_00